MGISWIGALTGEEETDAIERKQHHERGDLFAKSWRDLFRIWVCVRDAVSTFMFQLPKPGLNKPVYIITLFFEACFLFITC